MAVGISFPSSSDINDDTLGTVLRFDGSFLDSSRTGFPVPLTGGFTYLPSIVAGRTPQGALAGSGNAFSFTGRLNEGAILSSAPFYGSAGFNKAWGMLTDQQSFSCWVYLNSLATTTIGIVNAGMTYEYYSGYSMLLNSSRRVRLGSCPAGGGYYFNSNNNVTPADAQTWFHLVGTFSMNRKTGAMAMKSYVNGSLSSGASNVISTTATVQWDKYSLVIGRYNINDAANISSNCLIQDVRMHYKVLSQAEVTYLYNNT